MPFTSYPVAYRLDRQLLHNELTQLSEQGLDLARAETLSHALTGLPEQPDRATFDAWWHRLEGAGVGLGDEQEPTDLDAVRAARPDGPRRLGALPAADLARRLEAAWLGRAAGCLLGKPVEGWSRERIETYLRAAGEYPLRDYIPVDAAAAAQYRFYGSWQTAARGRTDGMPRDDDMDYPIIGLVTLERAGPDFRPDAIAHTWLTHLPYGLVYTAERMAYANLVAGLAPPASAAWANPYREWIGAQIRADIWGYVAAGWPERAADYAWRDAVVSHTRNGVYGEMFFAALIAAAFSARSLDEALDAALAEVPRHSRFTAMAQQVRAWAGAGMSWDDCWRRIDDTYGRYHWVHTLNNAAVVLAALLYGDGDFERTITLAVTGGYDTDCNGATAGSIVGALHGRDALPERWLAPIQGRLHSIVIGNTEVYFADLAERAARFAAAIGG